MPVLTESETNFYSFDGLSAGTYTLSVLKDGRTVYEVDKITVAAEADRVLPPHTISGFVRFKSPYGTALLYTPARLSDGYSVDENGYLTNGEDSAFWYSGGTVRFYRVCEEYCEVEGGFYRMPQYQNITLNDSKEYTLAPLSGFDLLQAQRIRFRFSLASGKSLAGLSVQVSTMGDYRKTVTLDQNGEATVLLPKPDVGGYSVSYSIADTTLYSEDGSVVAYLPSQHRFFMLWQSDTEVLLRPQLQETVIETIRLKFKSDAPLDGITGTLRSNLNDQLSFRLDASGEIELPLKAATPGDYLLSIDSRLTDDYYIPSQSLSLEGTDYTMTVEAQKIEKQTVKLKFTDPSGYSVEGASVLISTAFTRKEYTLGADGILSAEVLVESRNAEAKSISVQIFGRNGNILWDDSLYLSLADVLNGEYEIRINSLISIRMDGAGWNQYERYLFYTQDGTKKAIHLQSDNSVVPSHVIALGGELIAVPRPINTMWMLPNAAQERYDLLKSLTAIQSFVLNKETAETVFRIDDSKTEYYTVNSPTDLVGNRIPAFEYFVLNGDTPILASLGLSWTSVRIPKLTNGQRVIIRPRSTKDISESLKHLGTYCAEWILDDLSPHERSFRLGFQSIYEFRLEDKDGNPHDGALAYIFNNSKRLTTESSLRVNISDPLSTPETLFAAWVGYVEKYTASVYSYWVDACNSGTAARFDFNDITTAYPEPIVLTADYELLYRIPRYTGDHDTNIKSVKQQKDGSYLVRLTQNGATGYHSLIALPAGAFNVMLDGTEQSSRELELQPGNISHDVSFCISEADLKSDNSIRCYIITPQGNRSLQFVREIDHDIFAYSVPMKVSTNEVMFHEALRNGTSLLGPGITQPVQSIFYYNLGTRFGTYWGLERRLFTNAITGKTTSTEYDRLNPESQYYKPDYTVDDYRDTTYTAFAQGGSYKAFECKWVSFKANTDDFAIALNVDGAVTYIDTLWPNASYFSSTRIVGFKQNIPPDNLSCSFTAGYDKENNCYWLTSAFLEKYGFYDRSTGYGILPIPMSEPDSYPHTYKAELKFKYKNGAGETEMLKAVRAGAMGAYIDFTFDRPVLVDDAKRLVSVLLGGDALDGNVEALNAALTAFGNKQKAGENDVTVGQNVATKFRFTPDDPIEVGASVKVVGKKGILTYNGIEMAAFESEYVLITDAASDPITALFYSGIRELDAGARLDLMTDLTVTGSAGKITFRALNPAIATVDANGVVTAVSDGLAYFEIACGTVKTVAAVSVRNTPHTHSFTRELPLAEYLAGDATCTEPARYYYICSCGGVGTSTYAYGEAKGHVFGEWTLNLADNTCERICSVCGEAEKDDSMSLLSVSGSMARAGDTVRITVSLANNPGIAALAFRISYPKGAMTLESAVAGELFGNATRNPSAGLFLFDNATDVTENGTLLTLTFKVSDTAALGEYRIALEIVSCNNASEETILLCGGQANILIRDVLPGDVNGDGVVDTLDITRLRRYLAEEDVEIFPGADMTGDGTVTLADLACLRRYLVEIGTGLGA